MLDNLITLAVDELNTGSTTDEDFDRHEEHLNRSLYISENHALESRMTLGFYRSAPKPNGNFKGVAKTSCKFTEDIAVDGVDGVASLTAPIIISTEYSLPVGVTAAQVLKARQRNVALQDLDSVMNELNGKQSI